MRNRIKKYYRDVLTGILMTLSLSLTFFLFVNFIRLVNSLDEKNTNNKYVQEMFVTFDFMKDENGESDYNSVNSMNIVQALTTKSANVSCFIGAEISESTSYSYNIQYVVSNNEMFAERLKDGRKIEDALKDGNVFLSEYMMRYTNEKGGNKYIEVGGEELRVAGILKEKSVAGKDKEVIVFVDKMNDEQKKKLNVRFVSEKTSVVIKIGSNEEDILSVYNQINEKFNEYNVNLYAVNGISKNSNQLLLEYMNKIIQPVVLTFCIINVYVVTGMWVRRRLNECAIRKSLGATDGMIMRHLMVEMMKCVLMAGIFCVIIQLIYLQIVDKPFLFEHYVTDTSIKIIAVMVILIVVILCSYGKFIKKSEPVTAMRTM